MHFAFTKMHGTGNDFVVIDARTQSADWKRIALQVCARHFGVGADGLLLVRPSERAPIRMEVINSDGSTAEMCGNGLRCFAKWVVERGGVAASEGALDVETEAGVLRATFSGEVGAIERVRVSLGTPVLEPEAIPVKTEGPGPIKDLPLAIGDSEIAVTCISMGNPHAVRIVLHPVEEVDLARLGPQVERHERFPNGTNFEVVNIETPQRLRVRIWERGAGITLACGTGAAAALVAARLHGLADERVTVSLPGGDVQLEWDGKGPVWLEGPAAYSFEGEWSVDGHP